FAGLTTVLTKIGLKDVSSHLATAIRTMVVIIFAWIIVLVSGVQGGVRHIDTRTWMFLVLSGLSTGGAWLCRYRALKLGNVNKITPITKTSTILTMLLAFIFLGENLSTIMLIGMALIGTGTWLMLEFKKTPKNEEKTSKSWLIFAVLAAVFASLTAIFGSLGVSSIDANLWTAIRTMIVALLSWVMVFSAKEQKQIKSIKPKSYIFLILSGIATGTSWLFFYHALQIGNASLVVPIDQLSILLTMGFARIFLGERFSKKSLLGLLLLTTGILLPSLMEVLF
ncbi:MAG: EamA family transporter, partial [Defluviitaleaceae bacterium]|nr:EamA family transporter [Defluviitaleaceae bacterium]